MAMPMNRRDIEWSEFIRLMDDGSSIDKLVTWIEQLEINSLKVTYTRDHVILLKWVLTTTNRDLRDRVTRALFYIGMRTQSFYLRK